MKNLSKLMMVMALITIMASCKKGNSDTDPTNTQVTADDLLSQYITLQTSVTPSLKTLYFNKDGNDIKTTYDAAGSRRAQTTNVTNNILTFDVDGDGKKIYTFVLSKDKAGKISLSSYTYKNTDAPTATLDYAQINGITEAQDLKGKHFTAISHYYTMTFSETLTWQIRDQHTNDPSFLGYYVISPGAWKGTRPDGTEYMGISVPKWNGIDQPVVLVQSTAANSTIEPYKAD